MRKLVLALAALGVAIPYAANADTVIVHKHRPVYNEVVPPPFHHHHDRGKTVIIKHDND